MLNLVSLKRERFTGPLWLVTGTNGDVTGARSRISMINGTTGDTGDILIRRLDSLLFISKLCHIDVLIDCNQCLEWYPEMDNNAYHRYCYQWNIFPTDFSLIGNPKSLAVRFSHK
uniref:Recep_L_domain domain-containing protein n=1 Tax=Haemonchus placei TaxID=6290 RepID=A0A0N4WLV2_HAEPC